MFYTEVDTGERYQGMLVTETTTDDDIAEFVDCDPDGIGGDHDGWFTVPDLETSNSVGDVFEGDLILRLPNGDLTTAVNPYAWEAEGE